MCPTRQAAGEGSTSESRSVGCVTAVAAASGQEEKTGAAAATAAPGRQEGGGGQASVALSVSTKSDINKYVI